MVPSKILFTFGCRLRNFRFDVGILVIDVDDAQEYLARGNKVSAQYFQRVKSSTRYLLRASLRKHKQQRNVQR